MLLQMFKNMKIAIFIRSRTFCSLPFLIEAQSLVNDKRFMKTI